MSAASRRLAWSGCTVIAVFLVLWAPVTADAQTINTFPYLENFDAWPNGIWSSYPGGWTNEPNFIVDDRDWTCDNFGTTSSNTGPADDRTGGGKYMYYETSGPSTGQVCVLRSPDVDTSTPGLGLTFWYHMAGSAMGTLELEIWNGGGYTTVFSLSGPQQGSPNDPWLQSPLIPLIGYPAITHFRFRGIRGTSFTSDMAVDDVEIISYGDPDIEVVSLDAPGSLCGMSAAETITVTLRNNKLTGPETGFPITVEVTGPVPLAPTTENVNVVVPPFGTEQFTFAATADMATMGAYVFTITAALPGDTVPGNDVLVSTRSNRGPLPTPYFDDFEAPTVFGATLGSSWEMGIPAGPVIDTPAPYPGPNAWMTNLTGEYPENEISELLSPCLDLTGLPNPMVTFSAAWDLEDGWDGVVLQSSIDGGATWQNVGAVGDPQNWFNNSFIQANPGGQSEGWTGDSGGWVVCLHNLVPLVGQTSAEFRFAFASDAFVNQDGFAVDNFRVYEGDNPDVGVSGIVAPVSACGFSPTEPITVLLHNYNDGAMVTNFPVTVTVTGPTSLPPTTEMVNVNVPPSGSAQYTFAATADLSMPGTYTIEVTAGLVGDTFTQNDSYTSMVTNTQVTSLAYFQDFESPDHGWAVMGTRGTWQLGTPAGSVINTPPPTGGVNSWMTNLTGSYTTNENQWVQSPCMDFSAAVAPEVLLDIWWNSEFSWDGAVLQSSIDAGATWQNVGAFGDPNNWYTDNTINGNPGGQQEGWTGRNSSGNGSGGWVTAMHDLPGLAGQPSVDFRVAFGSDSSVQDDGFAFDNFIIREAGLGTTVATGLNNPAQPVQSADNRVGTVLLQVEFTSAVGGDVLRSFDLTASGDGLDDVGVDNVSIVVEDPLTTNGMIDPGEPVVFNGTYPADDGTINAVLGPPVLIPLGTPVNVLVVYDFSGVASGATPPATYEVTVSNVLTVGAVTVAGGVDPMGTAEVNMCPTTLCGDCNLDTFVDVLDSLLGAQHAALIVTLSGAEFSNCNVTGAVEPDPGAVVDVLDSLLIAQWSALIPVTLVCC